MKKSLLILLRHGQSAWNQKNLFTGWVDIPLTSQGIEEALKVGREMDKIPIDMVFTSDLIRAKLSACLAMSLHKSGKVLDFKQEEGALEDNRKVYSEKAMQELIPTYSSSQLNERMYGKLQGMNKDDARTKYGKEQVEIWRRSFDVAPPGGESLEMTMKRTIPYFESKIVPALKEGKNVLVSAHGNSLRSIVYFIEKMTSEEILKFEIPTGHPLCYSFEKGAFVKDTLAKWNT